MPKLAQLTPQSLHGYQRSWLSRDIIAGVTLAAVAIPETMGYTSIAQTPVVTGLYTVIFPTLVFALLGSSRLLVVGADSATAAILAAGLAGIGIAGLQPNSTEWLAWTSLVALVCGGLLVVARLLKLGFLGDFMSTAVLVGFLTGVGIQVFAGQIPDMLGIPKGSGNWFEQQWWTITHVGAANLWTVAFAVGALAIIVGFKRFLPKVPGAVVAVILSIILSSTLDASSHGVAVVGAVQGGFPPIGLPEGITWSDIPKVLGIAFSCFVLIIAQSAATSRSFAMKHNQRVDVNRDIVGLSGANFAAGLTGTFVVNGSPTKTQILDEQKGRTQVANMTMSVVVLIVVLFLTGLLTDMPKAVLAAIVFLIGVGLIDIKGLRADPGGTTQRVRHRGDHRRRRLRGRRRAGHHLGHRVVDPRDHPPRLRPEGLPGRRGHGRRHDLRQRRTRTPEPSRSAGVPLRRTALLRQRQPVLRPGPRPPVGGTDQGAVARPRLLITR